MSCVVRKRSLRRAHHSSRGVLSTVMRRCMRYRNLVNEEALTHWRLSPPPPPKKDIICRREKVRRTGRRGSVMFASCLPGVYGAYQGEFPFAISGFRREVNENCALLGYYAARSVNCLLTFRNNRQFLTDVSGPIVAKRR
jgi:hypothetical protein